MKVFTLPCILVMLSFVLPENITEFIMIGSFFGAIWAMWVLEK